MPEISVITVLKNPGESLARTLSSVNDQIYQDFEYIVIDGHSTDGTHLLLEKFSDRIQKKIIEEDRGIYDAMNKAIEIAEGNFIIFLNAGDHFTTDYSLEAVSQHMLDSYAIVSFGRILWVNREKKVVITSKHDGLRKRADLLKDNFPHGATIYRKKAFELFGLFDINYQIFADYEWNLRVLLDHEAPFTYNDIVVSTFYTGGVSTNPSNQAEREEELRSVKEKYLKNHKTKLKKKLNRLH